MEKLILQPSSTAQWYALVNEAEHGSAIMLGEELESYLVFLLMRFANQPQMVASIVAVEFLQGVKKNGAQRSSNLRDVGDKCLLFTGLFPGLAKHRRVSENYFIDLGQTAYTILSDNYEKAAELFARLAENFQTLIIILKNLRETNAARLQQAGFYVGKRDTTYVRPVRKH